MRVLTRSQHEFLQRVPEAVVSVCGVGSFSPGALLLDALELFDAQDAHADDNLRLIGTCAVYVWLLSPQMPLFGRRRQRSRLCRILQ